MNGLSVNIKMIEIEPVKSFVLGIMSAVYAYENDKVSANVAMMVIKRKVEILQQAIVDDCIE